MSTRNTEAALRDWIASHMAEFASLVKNLSAAMAAREAVIEAFDTSTFQTIEQLAAGALSVALSRKALNSLKALETGLPLLLLGTEIPMLASELPGRKPAADILALQIGSAAYALFEVKVSAETAREAITELSGYASGLGQRFWGMSSFDSIWLLVSTEYRTTLRAAVAYQLLVSGHCVIPLRANVDWREGKVASVALTVEDVTSLPDEFTCDSLFCDAVFDCVAARLEMPVASPDVACHFVVSAFERTGATGCCFQLLDELGHPGAPKPHGLVALTLNPFKLHKKSLRLRHLVEIGAFQRGTPDYTRDIATESIVAEVDSDVGTFKSILINEAEPAAQQSQIDASRSLRELADREPNSQTLAFQTVLEQLMISNESAEVNTPYLGDLLSPHQGEPQLRKDNIVAVRYFGVIHEIMMECARYLLRHDRDFAGMTLPQVYESPQLLMKIFRKCSLNLKA